MSKIEYLDQIVEVIKERKNDSPAESYTASLFQDGLGKIAQKVGEEATEIIVATLAESKERVISETADLLFHLLILLEAKEVSLDDVVGELEKRSKLR